MFLVVTIVAIFMMIVDAIDMQQWWVSGGFADPSADLKKLVLGYVPATRNQAGAYGLRLSNI